jgi:hypothetical protein
MATAMRHGPQAPFDVNLVEFPNGGSRENHKRFQIEKERVLAAVKSCTEIPWRQRPAAHAVAEEMAKHANCKLFNATGMLEAWPGVGSMAENCATFKSRIYRGIETLREFGFLEITKKGNRGHKGSFHYRLKTPDQAPKWSHEEDWQTSHGEPGKRRMVNPANVARCDQNLTSGNPTSGNLTSARETSRHTRGGPAYAGLYENEDPGYGFRSEDFDDPDNHGAPYENPTEPREPSPAPTPIAPAPGQAARGAQPTPETEAVLLIVTCYCGREDRYDRDLEIDEPARAKELNRWDCVAMDQPCEGCGCIGHRGLVITDCSCQAIYIAPPANEQARQNWSPAIHRDDDDSDLPF